MSHRAEAPRKRSISVAKAINASTTDDITKAAIARAAFGKAGASLGGVLTEIASASGVDALIRRLWPGAWRH